MDRFVILTPLLLLAVIALLGFVGCIGGRHYAAVNHLFTVTQSAPAGDETVTAGPLYLGGASETYGFFLATLQWGAPPGQSGTPMLSSGSTTFAPVSGGGPFDWNGMKVQTFWAFNPGPIDSDAPITFTATLSQPSTVPWNLFVTAYNTVDNTSLPDVPPIYSPQQSDPAYTGTTPQAPPIRIGTGDLVYAVGFAADSGGAFPGSNNLVAGSGFTVRGERRVVNNPILEDNPDPDSGVLEGSPSKLITAQVTNTTPQNNAKGFIVAMGIKALTFDS